ncbi:MAG: winged helix-turn-helix domain-containing protein [Chloroflexota bacterium]|nr:winged helix-turn-helix domain-containing protein [Chloroflexota bacterium]
MARLHGRISPGSAPRLSGDQRAQLRAALANGAPAFGVVSDVWTSTRIAALIKELFGVSYHPAHVSRIVRALGQSSRLPQTRAAQRDAAAIEAWHTERWPALTKGGGRRTHHRLGRRSARLPAAGAGTYLRPPAGRRRRCGCRSRATICRRAAP